jgi:hypothetical protein
VVILTQYVDNFGVINKENRAEEIVQIDVLLLRE